MATRKSYKTAAQAAEARATEAEKALAEMTSQMKHWRTLAQREEARASRMAKLLNDGTEAGALRLQLAEARAEADSLKVQAGWQRHETGGQDVPRAQQEEIDGHDIAYWHKQALSLKESYWHRTEETSKLTKELDALKAKASGTDKGETAALRAEVARLKAAQGGRPKAIERNAETVARAQRIREEGLTMKQTAVAMGISESTLRRLLRDFAQNRL